MMGTIVSLTQSINILLDKILGVSVRKLLEQVNWGSEDPPWVWAALFLGLDPNRMKRKEYGVLAHVCLPPDCGHM